LSTWKPSRLVLHGIGDYSLLDLYWNIWRSPLGIKCGGCARTWCNL